MNFALPGILIVLGLIPGVAFTSGYYSGEFARRFAQLSPVGEITRALVFALPLNVAWLGMAEPSADAILALVEMLTGAVTESNVQAVAGTLANEGPGIVLSFAAFILGAFLLGIVARRIVWASRIDLWVPALKMKSDWYHLLNGRRKGLPRWNIVPSADVMSHLPEGSRMYRGIVAQYALDKDGALDRLVLRNAERGHGRGDNFEWTKIPGESFVLMGSQIHSINVKYFSVLPREGVGLKFKIGAIARALFAGGP